MGAKSTLNKAGAAGARKHFSKMATQASQLQGSSGRMTGGFATSPGAPKISNNAGKFLAKGKN